MRVIEALCKEVGFTYDKRMENTEMLVAFIGGLLNVIAQRHARNAAVDMLIDAPPRSSYGAGDIIDRAQQLLLIKERHELIDASKSFCRALPENGKDGGQCDHTIDMVNSCVAAIWFGLEDPEHSRHAAEAASHVWSITYGLTLFTIDTIQWEKSWARQKMQDALVSLAFRESE